MLGKIRKIHFVGIGGIGMSGIAEVLLNLGFAVSGSDIKATPVTERLAGPGGAASEGPAPASVPHAPAGGLPSARTPDHPEAAGAQALQIPAIPPATVPAPPH